MTKGHYGVRAAKARPSYTAPAPGSAWSGSALVSISVLLVIMLALLVYGVHKTVTNVDTVMSALRTTGEGSPAGSGTR